MRTLTAVCTALTLCLWTPASSPAVDVKLGGSLEFMMESFSGITKSGDAFYMFQDSRDVWNNLAPNPNARADSSYFRTYHGKHERVMQRMVLKATFTVSPQLYAYYDAVLGSFTWGGPAGTSDRPHTTGGALGTRAANIVTHQAYLNWTIPHTRATVRMGELLFYLPGFATGSLPIKTEFGTGLMASTPINDRLSATFLWQRVYSGPRRGSLAIFPATEHSDDTFDVFALTTPLKLDGCRFGPYAAMAVMGKDSIMTELDYARPNPWGGQFPAFSLNTRIKEKGFSFMDTNMMPVWSAAAQANVNQGTRWQPGNLRAWWLGLGGETTRFDPWRLAFDFAWSQSRAGHAMFNRGGWYTGVAASYKTAYGAPTLKAWYASGDDGNIANGSERPLAWNGSLPDMNLLTGNLSGFFCNAMEQGTLAGTWGVSLQWNKLSLLPGLTHHVRVTYVQGTNNQAMIPYARNGLDTQRPPSPGYVVNYLGRSDSMVEADVETHWQIQKNLRLFVDVAYLFTHFDASAWGQWNPDHTRLLRKASFSNPWHVSAILRFDF